MSKTGSSERLARIRLMGAPEMVADLAGKLVDLLEDQGYLVLEWSAPYPCRQPDEDKNRVYVTAVKQGELN